MPCRRNSAPRLAFTGCLFFAFWGVTLAAAAPPEQIEFNRDVRPILAENCYACHGPDARKRQADLRLDTQAGLLEARGDEPATVVAGQPERSPLWQRVTSDSADERMPPVDSGKELTENDRAILRRWIEQGAHWEGHWAFNPIKRAAPPAVANPAPNSAIDAFVVAELGARGLAPSPPADRATLLRRLSFDLIGLPPAPEDLANFLEDERPEAYEAQVDRLLESPHFGERMAIWWLDLVRYADSVGYHGDQSISIFPFRQYVIDSFNANKPFDQFTREQLAGDLRDAPTREEQIASGYNRLGMMSAEGGVQPKEYLAKYIAERVRNVSGAWLGVTIGCAECHDHKFDPFTTRDFYQMEAFFADIQERGLYAGANADGNWGPSIKVPSAEQAAALASFDQQIDAARQTLATTTPELESEQAQWEAAQPRWQLLRPASFSSAQGAQLTLLDDGSLLVAGARPANDVYTLVVPSPPANITAFRLEALPHDSLPQMGPGRADNGNFVLTELRVAARAAQAPTQELIAWGEATASFEQDDKSEQNPYHKLAAAAAVDNDVHGPNLGWAVANRFGQPHHAVFQTAADLSAGEGATLSITLVQQNSNPAHTLGRFRIWATSSPSPVRAMPGLPTDVAQALAQDPASRDEATQKRIAEYYRSIAPTLDPVRARLKELTDARTALDRQIPTTLVTARVEPRMVRVLARGNWMDENGETVAPGVPAFLPQPPTKERLTRADLADWLVAADNPLTARVLANRLWKLYFGAGLSRRVDDLGAQGEWPSHPLLLDYLASRTIDSGWDVKALIKEIVMSGTYRQSSLAPAAARDVDPDNRWLARQGRFRLDAEMVRDNALAISGLLIDELGGPSVYPYQPPGYWAYLNFPQREWQNGTGRQLYRRGLYTHWQRQYLHPSLLAFDAPSREECAADRPRSNTPLQALVLLNDPSYVEAARAFAASILSQPGDFHARLDWAFTRALARRVRPEEEAVLLGLFEKHLHGYVAQANQAVELAHVGEWAPPSDLDPAHLAAWTSVARTILNLHETVTRN